MRPYGILSNAFPHLATEFSVDFETIRQRVNRQATEFFTFKIPQKAIITFGA